MAVELIVCETCRQPGEPLPADGRTPGAELAEMLGAALAGAPDLAEVRLTTMRCLMSCKRACSLSLRSPGKMAYVLGDMQPEAAAVDAVIGYVRGYRESPDGVVPFKRWPDGVKGRFVARLPPLPG